MKHLRTLLLLSLLALFIAACGTEATPVPNAATLAVEAEHGEEDTHGEEDGVAVADAGEEAEPEATEATEAVVEAEETDVLEPQAEEATETGVAAEPTEVPATEVPATEVPPTEAPPTEVPPTVEPTAVPPTEVPATEVTPTEVPPTVEPTAVPPTEVPATELPATEAEIVEEVAEEVVEEVAEEVAPEATPYEMTAEDEQVVQLVGFFGDPANGERLFQEVYDTAIGPWQCIQCHYVDQDAMLIGPGMLNLIDRAGERIPGMPAELYTYNSIIAPNDYIVEGYAANVMPGNYAELLSEQDLYDISAYLLSLEG